jgi:hypothetical protein
MMTMKKFVMNCFKEFNIILEEWFEWVDAKRWAKAYHPSWVRFATKISRPEIRETYRKKILETYRNRYE